jgi:hypothetical protein
MLRIRGLLGVSTLLLSTAIYSQGIEEDDGIVEMEDYSIEYAATINASELRDHLMIIASDEF